MKRAAVALALFLVAAPVAAQEEPPFPPPDFSRDTLIRLFEEIEVEDDRPRVRHRFGAVDFRAFGTRWRVGYLPFMAPLPGSMPWINGERWPDPFRLSGTEIPHTSRTWNQRRQLSSELKRIDRLTRRATIVAKPE
ncbi:MAG TPA: hypothetical protein VMS98_20615 [Thermoanaerobaculia bacterium]|nr:hypothetical protein [Thermoanaerobaculia bacterium]